MSTSIEHLSLRLDQPKSIAIPSYSGLHDRYGAFVRKSDGDLRSSKKALVSGIEINKNPTVLVGNPNTAPLHTAVTHSCLRAHQYRCEK